VKISERHGKVPNKKEGAMALGVLRELKERLKVKDYL